MSSRSSSANPDVVQALLLFAFSAQVWFALSPRRNRNSSSSGDIGDTDQQQEQQKQQRRRSGGAGGQKRRGSAEAWRRRRHRRRRDTGPRESGGYEKDRSEDASEDTSKDTSKDGSGAARADAALVDRRGSEIRIPKSRSGISLTSVLEEEEGEGGHAGEEQTESNNEDSSSDTQEELVEAEEELNEAIEELRERRRVHMERISLSDSALAGQSSVDFLPKNSNWNHFEGYKPSSPIRSQKSPVAMPPRVDLPYPNATTQSEAPSHARDVNRFSMGGDQLGKACHDQTVLKAGATESNSDSSEEDFLWIVPPALHEEDNNNHDEETDDDDEPESCVAEEGLEQCGSAVCTFRGTGSYDNEDAHADRASFNAEFMPRKLICVRHGQSEGNMDHLLYATKPDNAMRLTKLGWEMAYMAGKALRKQFPPGETVHFVVSPYTRTVETFHGICSAWADPREFDHIPNRNKRMKAWYAKLLSMGLTWHEDPRIREQDFGNYQDPEAIMKAKKQRNSFGPFYYRFPHGESASDVFDRVSTFLDSLWRSFELRKAGNYVLVTHGVSIRVFLARYFRYSIDQFNMLANPQNCEMIILAHDGRGKLQLDGRCELDMKAVVVPPAEKDEEKEDGEQETAAGEEAKAPEKEGVQQQPVGKKYTVTGYRMHKRLRTLPPQYVQARTIRMCFEDTCDDNHSL